MPAFGNFAPYVIKLEIKEKAELAFLTIPIFSAAAFNFAFLRQLKPAKYILY